MRSLFIIKYLACLLFVGLSIILAPVIAEAETSIVVTYPKPDQILTAVDSSFIFGRIAGEFNPETQYLKINNSPIDIHKDGGFLAFLQLVPGDFIFHLSLNEKSELELGSSTLIRDKVIATFDLPVKVPIPLTSLPQDSLQISGEYRPPSGDLWLKTGDRLDIWFQGTPGLNASFSILGIVDHVPMVETEPQLQPYWGKRVFGQGMVPDSVKIKGIYSGYWILPESLSVIDSPIIYHLTPPDRDSLLKYLIPTPHGWAIPEIPIYLAMGDTATGGLVTMESSYRLNLNDPAYPFAIKFTDSMQTIRYGPRLGYFSIFQPEGVMAMVVGREGNWYKAELSHSQFAWININSVERLPKGILPPQSKISSIRTYSSDDNLLVEFPLTGNHPFRVYVDDSRTIRLQLFGVTSNTDWIRYDFSDDLIEIATWSQPEDDLYELRLKLSSDLWGYDTYYSGNTFYLKLNRPPDDLSSLWGKRIVIDPGHSSDAGAIGPTGYTEAEANLGIALVLRDLLKKKGALPLMTRDDMSHVPLYDRPAIAKQYDADLFISIHNNALPDGVNPFTNNGVATLYYHPHSINLAKAIQTELIKATKLPDFGLYHGNLAVNRPTQYPAVLVECSFMMIPEQEAKLKKDKYRKKIAKSIVKGIENFLKGYDDRN